MKRCVFRILSVCLIFVILSCSGEISDKNCTVELNVDRGISKSLSYSVSSVVSFEYNVVKSGEELSESGWTPFDVNKNPEIKNLNPGMWTISVRGLKDNVVYFQGKEEVNLSSASKKKVGIVLNRVGEVKQNGTLKIIDTCNYRGLKVNLRYTGTSEDNIVCDGVPEYLKTLKEGFYSVSIVYLKDSYVVGGCGFAVYIPPFETVTVNLNTVLNAVPIPVDVSVDFCNLSAPYVEGYVCTGYTKNGARIEFPYHTTLYVGDEINLKTLGFEPVYVSLSDTASVLSADYVELWAKDLPFDGMFSGNTRLTEKTPKYIVLNADNGRIGKACLAYLRDLEKAYIRGAVTIAESAFSRDTKLKEVYFSKSLKNMGLWMFNACSSLKDLYFETEYQSNINFVNYWNDNAPSNIQMHFGVGF